MPKLKLHNIVCHVTEDHTGADEAYLRINGSKVWGPKSMNDESSRSLDEVAPISFKKTIPIDLYDEDSGWFDNDDHLGRTYAYASQAGEGELKFDFMGDGAHYELFYEVLP